MTGSGETRGIDAGRIRVMLVDDHALVRAAVRQALAAPDLELVGEAASAEDALLAAPTLRPDVLLLDIDLPGMDGVQLVRELAPRLPDTRIVMLTVSAADRDVAQAMRNGAAGYLTKDLSPEALQRAVRSAHRGELAMPRVLADRLVRTLVAGAGRGHDGREDLAGSGLTARELEVLRLLADGMTDREIAASLTISTRTVETHVGSILHKLGARNRAEAARRYVEGARLPIDAPAGDPADGEALP
jgi:DNA-binding NarL/FixJ family response regulator